MWYCLVMYLARTVSSVSNVFCFLQIKKKKISYGKVTPDERTRWGRHVGANRVHRRG